MTKNLSEIAQSSIRPILQSLTDGPKTFNQLRHETGICRTRILTCLKHLECRDMIQAKGTNRSGHIYSLHQHSSGEKVLDLTPNK